MDGTQQKDEVRESYLKTTIEKFWKVKLQVKTLLPIGTKFLHGQSFDSEKTLTMVTEQRKVFGISDKREYYTIHGNFSGVSWPPKDPKSSFSKNCFSEILEFKRNKSTKDNWEEFDAKLSREKFRKICELSTIQKRGSTRKSWRWPAQQKRSGA